MPGTPYIEQLSTEITALPDNAVSLIIKYPAEQKRAAIQVKNKRLMSISDPTVSTFNKSSPCLHPASIEER